MEERDVAVIILLNKEKEVLLQKKDLRFKTWPGYWCFFGGKIEEGETPEQAIVREVKEEINYELQTIDLFKIQDYTEKTRKGKKYIFIGFFTLSVSHISLKEGAGFGFFAEHELDFMESSRRKLSGFSPVMNAAENS